MPKNLVKITPASRKIYDTLFSWPFGENGIEDIVGDLSYYTTGQLMSLAKIIQKVRGGASSKVSWCPPGFRPCGGDSGVRKEHLGPLDGGGTFRGDGVNIWTAFRFMDQQYECILTVIRSVAIPRIDSDDRETLVMRIAQFVFIVHAIARVAWNTGEGAEDRPKYSTQLTRSEIDAVLRETVFPSLRVRAGKVLLSRLSTDPTYRPNISAVMDVFTSKTFPYLVKSASELELLKRIC